MTDFWDSFLDNEGRQRGDINQAARELDWLKVDVERLQQGSAKLADQESLRQECERLQARFDKLKQAHLRLRSRTDRIELVVEALFVHLESTGSLALDRLRELVEQIDAADGKVDGRARKRPTAR